MLFNKFYFYLDFNFILLYFEIDLELVLLGEILFLMLSFMF